MCGILDFEWKYGEGKVLSDLSDHLKRSYESHYSNDMNGVQTLDVFEARGTLADTSIDNAIKYLMRYGKKAGRNKKDLLKAMHYLVLATAFDEKVGVYDEDKQAWEDFQGDFEVQFPVVSDFLNSTPAKSTMNNPPDEYDGDNYSVPEYSVDEMNDEKTS